MEAQDESGTQTTSPEVKAPETPVVEADPSKDGILRDLRAERERRQAAEARIAELSATAAKVAEYEARLPTLEARISEFEAKEAARIEAVRTANLDRIAALPEAARALVPEGLAPEALAGWLERAQQFVAAPVGTVAHGGSPPGLPPEAVAWFDARGVGQHLRTLEFWNRVKPK